MKSTGEIETIPITKQWIIHRRNKFVRAHLPLKISFSTSCHKGQRQTCDILHTTIYSQLFEPGMAAIALSRVKTLNGLHLKDIEIDDKGIPALSDKTFRYYKNLLKWYFKQKWEKLPGDETTEEEINIDVIDFYENDDVDIDDIGKLLDTISNTSKRKTRKRKTKYDDTELDNILNNISVGKPRKTKNMKYGDDRTHVYNNDELNAILNNILHVNKHVEPHNINTLDNIHDMLRDYSFDTDIEDSDDEHISEHDERTSVIIKRKSDNDNITRSNKKKKY